MSDKVLREFQIIETEDGFRIEMKGDKEELRRMLFGGEGMPGGFGPFGGRGWGFGPFGGRGRGHGHGPFGRHGGPWGHRHGPEAPFEHDAPMPEDLREALHAQKHKLREAMEHRRRFGARWEARWGYDLGPWWDDETMPPSSPGTEPTGEPPADV